VQSKLFLSNNKKLVANASKSFKLKTSFVEITDFSMSEQSAQTQQTNSNQPSYTKLAMRNMVRKPSKSLQHFFLSTIGLLALFIGLSYLTR